MSGQCSICLSEYDEPVCIPCGHVYCVGCITDVVNSPEETGTVAKCPTCRSEFHLVVPDLTYIPKKYHPFVVSPLRRIYLDESTELVNLERDVAKYKARLQSSREREELLMKECERHQKKSRGYRAREQEARVEKEKLELQCEMLVEKVSTVEKEVELRESTRQRAMAKNAELQRDVKRLQDENEVLAAKFNALKLEMESPKRTPRKSKAAVMFDSSDSECDSELDAAPMDRIVRPLPRRTRKFSSGATSLSPKAPAPKKARISDTVSIQRAYGDSDAGPSTPIKREYSIDGEVLNSLRKTSILSRDASFTTQKGRIISEVRLPRLKVEDEATPAMGSVADFRMRAYRNLLNGGRSFT